MKNKCSNLSFVVIICLFIFYACSNKFNYDLTPLYEGDKIVLNGYLDSDSGCVVKVSKSSPASGQYTYDRLKLNDVRVFLYENGDSILELKGDTLSKFTAKAFKAKVGAHYKIRAVSATLPPCESEEEIFNPAPQVRDTVIRYKENVVPGYRDGILFSFRLDFDSLKKNFYTFKVIGDTAEVYGSLLLTLFNGTFTNGNDNTCGSYILLFNTACLQSGQIINIGSTLQTSKSRKAKIYKLSLSSTSEIYFKYIFSLPESVIIDNSFQEPNPQYTNIKGGYGIFYTKNTSVLTFSF